MNPIHILLVEDNEGDIILTLEALKEGKIRNHVSIVKDGELAIRFLNREGEFLHAERPDMVLLDINLPRIDGIEVLSYIKTHPSLKTIPVVMLTTSTAERDIADSYKNYANCYISKPVDLDKFFEMVRKIENFWISIVHLPKND